MENNKKTARIAGIFYFLFLIFGMFAQLTRGNIILPDNAAATLKNITDNLFLFRMSFVSDILGDTVYIFLVLYLYKMLSPVNKNTAMLMTLLVLSGIPVAISAQFNLSAAAYLLGGPAFLNSVDPVQLNAQAMSHIGLYQQGIYFADIFWGLWLIPFGYLVYKSGFQPKSLGVLLMAGSSGFLSEFIVMNLQPAWQAVTYPFLAVGTIAEISAIFWFLIWGIKKEKKA